MDDLQPITPLWQQNEPITIRVENNIKRGTPAYVRLLDPDFEKEGIKIDIPVMDDPTIGHLINYRLYLAEFKGKEKRISHVYLWCPLLSAQLDLFTLHVYEDHGRKVGHVPVFTNLRVFSPRIAPEWMQPGVAYLEARFAVNEFTRIAFNVPAFSKMLLDLYPEKTENT